MDRVLRGMQQGEGTEYKKQLNTLAEIGRDESNGSRYGDIAENGQMKEQHSQRCNAAQTVNTGHQPIQGNRGRPKG